jgi:hypothetical protein
MYTWQRPSIFMRDKPIISLERILHNDNNREDSIAKQKNLVMILERLGAKTN